MQQDFDSVGCPIVLGKVVKNWYRDHDMFYDHFSQTIIFHKEGKFYIQYMKKADEPQRILKFNIGTTFERIFACSVSQDGNMLACQTEFNTVYVFNNSQKVSPHGVVRTQYEIEEYKFQYKDVSKILGFSFVSSTYFNFFICTDKEIEILNFNKFSSNVVHIKKIPISGSFLLYELQFYNILTIIGHDGSMSVVNLDKLNSPISNQQILLEGSGSVRMSFSERTLSIFKSSTAETNFEAKEPINNKNIILLAEKDDKIDE